MGRPFQDGAPSDWCQSAVTSLEEQGTNINGAIEQIICWIDRQHKPGFHFEVNEVDDEGREGPCPTGSRIGGRPFLLPGESWPCVEGSDKKMSFVYQIRLDSMPREVQDAMGHTSGLFQVFFDTDLPGFDINNDKGYYLVRVVPQEEIDVAEGSVRDVSVPPGLVMLSPCCEITGVTPCVDLPHVDDVLDMMPEELKQAEGASDVAYALQDAEVMMPHGGDKLAGWPDWCQGPEWGLTDEGGHFVHVMQVEASHTRNLMIGDAGTLIIQRHPTDANHWRLGWACG
mmetsp:Transcript_15208/g.32964  ORF Transcript_15208/g.32964 Transcript_15208/m.32964 type:complete len:285 (+) Transcript_15208:101-955(+)